MCKNQHCGFVLKTGIYKGLHIVAFCGVVTYFHMLYSTVSFVWQQFVNDKKLNMKAPSTLTFKCHGNGSLTNDAEGVVVLL